MTTTLSPILNALNFSGGPGVLPDEVLTQAQQALIAVPGPNLSVLGISHRSKWFLGVIEEVEDNIRTLLNLPADYHVLLLQGGATQQFSMIPMNWLKDTQRSADYLHTGYWSGKALPEAQMEGDVRVIWSGDTAAFRRLPGDNELIFDANAAYFHYISNETVEGLQFHRVPGREDVPRVCDMSSDFLSKPIDVNRFSLIYAHAQKNLGPAGVTVVLLHQHFLGRASNRLPGFLDYRKHIAAHSIYNTPPVFAIYVVLLVTRWLLNTVGGLDNMAAINTEKARCLYQVIDDSSGFYKGWPTESDRSLMNVVFNLPDAKLEEQFLSESLGAGFSGLSGHRAIGGIRASIYNAMPLSSVKALAEFMSDFQGKKG